MSNSYPFHYEVRVKLLAFDSHNNVRHESFTKEFSDTTPLENRKRAFEEFSEYLSFLEQTKRVEKNKQGNYYISQPSFVSEIQQKSEGDYLGWKKEFDQYKEEISIFYLMLV